ncbi:hypothetical protein PIB30_015453 [Stylosanthes scabra]|uniref:DUF295 domain-containing protein n=1 Tax=Stylosanthes scabra TaxID=79078 RepID=A0ABU6U7C6_9FABA|nr:hypothetical protein [Stylosanthes scabra]
MHALELDSKIHFIGGHECKEEDGTCIPSKEVYELDLDYDSDDDNDDEDNKANLNASETIPQAPIHLGEDRCFVTKIKEDYYFLILDDAAPTSKPKDNFWVLRSETREWERLTAAPNPGIAGIGAQTNWFVFYDVLYIRIALLDGRIFVLNFETNDAEKGWTMYNEEDEFTNSFWIVIDGQRRFCTPHILPFPSLPGFDFDCCVALSFTLEEKFMIHALLVTRLGVKVFQQIKGCFDEIPTFLRKVEPILIDLGDGKICVMVSGYEKQHGCGDRFLCVLILSLTVNEKVEVNLLEYSAAERDFLTVGVISNSLYMMLDDPNEWYGYYVFPHITEGDDDDRENDMLDIIEDDYKRREESHARSASCDVNSSESLDNNFVRRVKSSTDFQLFITDEDTLDM